MAVIIDYEDQYLKDFQRLNLEWLEKLRIERGGKRWQCVVCE